MAAAFMRVERLGVLEDYWSTHWLEYLGHIRPEDQIASLRAWWDTAVSGDLSRSKGGRFARLNIGEMKRAVEDVNPPVALVAQHEHRRLQEIDPHAGVYGMPPTIDPRREAVALLLKRIAVAFPAIAP